MTEIFLFNQKETKLDKTIFVNLLFSKNLSGLFNKNTELSIENQVSRYKITQTFKHEQKK
jgi:hypothetical protein